MNRITHDNLLTHLPSVAYDGAMPADCRPFGKHLIIDLSGCTFRVSDGKAITQYAAECVALLGMTAYGPAQVVHFGHASPDTSGFTLVQLIETSSIVGHFVDAERTAHLDVFSCQDFDDAAAVTHAEQFFGADASVVTVLYR